MRKIFIFFLAIAMWSSSCVEPEPPLVETYGTLEIVFKTLYAGNPMPLFQSNPTGLADPTSITFKKLDFFISDIKGIGSSGDSTVFTDVGYIAMNSLQSETTFTIENVPLGTYSQLNFGVGLPDEVNSMNPSNFSTTSPLGINANYWANWNSYILCKIEGDVMPLSGVSSAFLYHAGVNGMYQPRSFAQNYSISDGQTTQITIYLHAEDIIFRAGNEINVLVDDETHSGTLGSAGYNLAKQAIENLGASLSLQP